MQTVTVCMPAYRSGAFLAEALDSLLRQTHSDFLVTIAVDPPVEQTVSWIEPFVGDPRFRVHVNPRRLGWDANIHQLLDRVTTPFFLILPHDDLLHPRYIEVLLRELLRHPDAVVAYADMRLFGVRPAQRKCVELPNEGSVEEQVLAFFAAGAEAVPWRGVTRTSVIAQLGGFPVDGHMGFAVECEWALGLISAGRAVHVPKGLFFKRLHGADVLSASRARLHHKTEAEIRAAFDRHRRVMLGLMERCVPECCALRQSVEVAAHIAMFRRLHDVLGGRLTPAESESVTKLLVSAEAVLSTHPRAFTKLQALAGPFMSSL